VINDTLITLCCRLFYLLLMCAFSYKTLCSIEFPKKALKILYCTKIIYRFVSLL